MTSTACPARLARQHLDFTFSCGRASKGQVLVLSFGLYRLCGAGGDAVAVQGRSEGCLMWDAGVADKSYTPRLHRGGAEAGEATTGDAEVRVRGWGVRSDE